MKKFLLLLTIIIFMFSMNLAYGVEAFTDIQNDASKEAVSVLSSYHIIDGYPDNTFKPDMPVTRAEMAKIITIAAGYYEYSKNMTSVYDDMNGHWAESYVELANVLNIVSGITNNKYGPDNYIKFNEATTMIVRLLGYNDQSLGGFWPENYYEKATQLNLFQNLTRQNHDLATRRDISIMLYNALNCDLVEINSNNTVNNTGKKLLSLVGSYSTKEVTINDLKSETFDYTDYLFNTWDFYYDLDGKLVNVSNPRFSEISGTVTNLLSNRVIFITDDYGNVRAFKMPDVPIIINGSPGSYDSLQNAKIKIISTDNSLEGKIIGAVAYKATSKSLIDKNNLYKTGSNLFCGKYLPLNSNGQINYNKLHISGDASLLSEIKTDDLVYFYEPNEINSNSSLTLEVLRKQISGTVSNVQKSENTYYYTVNNVVYKTGSSFIFTEAASLKDNVTFVLDKNNDIVKLYINSYGKVPSTYGIVLSADSGTNATAKILDEYGNIKTYSLAENSSVVSLHDNGYSIQHINSLKKNDIVLFDPVLSGNLKIINEMPTYYLSAAYNEMSQTLSNGSKITSDTFIVYENNGRYQILKPSRLGSYLSGKTYAAYGHVNAMYLTSGLKVDDSQTTIAEPSINSESSSYSGTVLGIISSTKKIDSSTTQVKFFNNYNSFYVSNSINIASMQNSYVKAVISNNNITSIQKLIPETDRIKITQVYSNQLLIDGITYMEYASNVKVYECSRDSSGNITSVKTSSKYSILSGSTAQLYDLYGSFDGVIDVILIYNN